MRFLFYVTESSSKPLIQRSPSLADIVTMAKQQQQHKAELEINSPHLGQLTASMKANFDDIRTEQAIILHDNLELQERYFQSVILEIKLLPTSITFQYFKNRKLLQKLLSESPFCADGMFYTLPFHYIMT